MFRAKDVILYKKIRFRFSSEGFVDILKKSIKCIFAYLSFLGKLLKEFRQEKFFWLKITKGIQAWKVCCTNHGFWCAWGVHIPFRNTKSTKNTFSEDIFQKKVEKKYLNSQFWNRPDIRVLSQNEVSVLFNNVFLLHKHELWRWMYKPQIPGNRRGFRMCLFTSNNLVFAHFSQKISSSRWKSQNRRFCSHRIGF